MIFGLFILSVNYGQGKKSTSKTIFGKPVVSGKINPNNGIVRCATVEYEKYLQEKNPKRMNRTQFEDWLAPLVKKQKAMRTSSQIGEIITIPVVVHVIHSGQAVGVAPNIIDAQIQSQITVLNEDFRKMAGTPGGESTNPLAADVKIEFALAKEDPNGNPTNGIDRVLFCQESWAGRGTDIDMIIKPATIWDANQYLNIWTVNMSDDILGYAYYPDGGGLSGIPPSGNDPTTDGIVVRYNSFGSSDHGSFLLNTPYDKGRTLTHEAGHWLGLIHIWGNGTGDEEKNLPDCTASDYCADTPQAGWEHYNCGIFDTCTSEAGNDMVENYMDYTNDECMNIFTQDQKDRMTTIMNNAARRNSLRTSTKNLTIPLFANDAEIKIEGSNCVINTQNASCKILPPPANKQVAIYNRGTSSLTSLTLNYTINGGTNQIYTWTGTLTQHESAIVTLPNTNFYGTLNVSIGTTNGGSDQRVSNNTATATFIAPSIPENYNFTTYTFTLQQDKWGSETKWNLKDGAGTTLYTGGPYTNEVTLPAIITQTWTLASNQCYTFTINDSEGDGICCGTENGDGYFNIKSADRTIEILSGAEFDSGKYKSFTTNTLGINEFETSEAIYLYPNPTKGTLNIRIPNNFGLPNSFTLSNLLGQKISQKVVSKETDLTISTSALSNGVYFITLVKEDQKRTLRFIKE